MINALQDPVFVIALFLIVGLVVGSFLNVVIYRLPRILESEWQAQCAEMRGQAPAASEALGIAFPGSRCPQCKSPIRAFDNIPVVSYVLLRGRCRNCSGTIPLRYPAVELLTGLLTAYAAQRFGFGLALGGACLFIWAVIALAFIDLDTQLLPDDITLPLLWLGLLLNLNGTFTDLASAVIGAAVGYLTLWSVYWAFKLATGKEGMGYGDFKLLAAIGAWFGWQMMPMAILASSLAGAAIGIALIVFRNHARSTPIPFGPYLAVAGLMSLFWGATLTRQYLGLVY